MLHQLDSFNSGLTFYLWNGGHVQTPTLLSAKPGDEPDDGGMGTHTLAKPDQRLKEPSFYKVLLMNDDFTPMDFVVLVLTKIFNKSTEEATKIMLQVHQQGSGVAGIFSHEIAETKVYLVNDLAKKNKHPLKCVMEKE